MASCLYHFVERPSQSGLSTRPAGVTFRMYGLAVASFLALFAGSLWTGGFPQRFPDRVLTIASYSDDRPPSTRECAFSSTAGFDRSACRIGEPDAEPTWIVFGDSHAWAARDAFHKWLARRGQSGFLIFRNSCLPLKNVGLPGGSGRCLEYGEAIYDALRDASFVDSVLMVSAWRQVLESRITDGDSRKLTPKESKALFHARFDESIQLLISFGVDVYVWEPVPGAEVAVPPALARAEWLGYEPDLRSSLHDYYDEFAFFFEALERNRIDIAGTYSPTALLCTAKGCSPTIDGMPAFFDNSHVSWSHGDSWAEMMLQADERRSGPRVRDQASS
ncbi:MAG: SGNH hydrolase domain-containing protein [bacterium]